ncbi:type III secretion HpaP family protein [Dyella sp. 2RAB6]|uniref:type III secretion HpaP family protein n=1 Tax=Dyella sp. 2RAB6 TaxID=3232992 RepID=UPI003F8DDDC5
MRNDATTATHTTPPAAHTHGSTQRAKDEPARGREDIQRFRKLMDGKGQDAQDGDEIAAGPHGLAASDQEKALRELLQRQLDAAAGKATALPPRDGERDSGSDTSSDSGGQPDGQGLASAGAQAWQQAQQIVLHGAEQPAPAAQAALAPALAELIERHVKQLLVPDARSSAQSREIMITLKNGVLPGTELWLSRTDKGWKLRADTRSPDAYRQLLEGAPQLIERFASRQLGELEIDPSLLS